MNRTFAAFSVLAALLLSVAGFHSASVHADGTVTKTLTFTVDALTAGDGGVYFDTGFVLKAGLPVTLTATGTASCAPGCGPYDANGPGPISANCVFIAPSLPPLSLIGQVGSGTPFEVGTGPTVVTGSGPLLLAYNDCATQFGDNAGTFTVTATYTCQPGNGYGDANHYHCGAPGQS